MVSTSTRPASLEQFLEQPETKPASEYIHGEVILKPMPQAKHSLIQGELTTTINRVLRPQRLGWAFPELRCTFTEQAIVPDIAVITWERIPVDEKGDIKNQITFCPDWIIEILSPDQPQSRLIKKITYALDHGCLMGWIIDSQERVVFAYHSSHEFTFYEDPQSRLAVPPFAQELHLTVETLFAWMQVAR